MQNVNVYNKTPSARTPRNRERNQLTTSHEKDPVKVFCRLRPIQEDFEESCVKLVSSSTLSLSLPDSARITSKVTHCTFEHIFTSYSDQKEVFDHVARPLLQNLLSGKNGLLFTYGVTGSGKTYTLTGDQQNPGILPQCVSILFNTIENVQSTKYVIKSDNMNGFEIQSESEALADQRKELKRSNTRSLRSAKKMDTNQRFVYDNDGSTIAGLNNDNIYAVFISYVEIYNNCVFDLLDDFGGKVPQPKLLREDSQRNMYVNSAREVEVKSADEIFELLLAGQKRKRMAHTALNAESSRSHSIFNIRVVQLAIVARNSQGDVVAPDKTVLTIGQLSLVDLAGSERCSRTQNTGIRLKEASSINNSLMTLRTCIEVLRENQTNGTNRMVPYRDSRLTFLFKNYFEGDGAVRMIVCVNPSINDYDENLQVMKFAEMTQEVHVTRPEVRHVAYRKTPKPPSRFLSARTQTPSINPLSRQISRASSFFGVNVPRVKINLENPDIEPIRNLIQCLKSRRDKRNAALQENTSKCDAFRQHLVELSQSNINNALESRTAKTLLNDQKRKIIDLQKKVADVETEKNLLIVRHDTQDVQLRELRDVIHEKDQKISKNVFEKERVKKKMYAQNEKMNHELDNKLRRQREQLEAKMTEKNHKINLVRKILDSDCNVEATGTRLDRIEAKEKENVDKPAPSTTAAAVSTPYRRPVANTRNRRSRSVGEVWLEHTQVNPVPLGTLMQPTMKRRKSVSKLNTARDITNPKQNKYCLLAQEADTDGEIETRLYKADIIPTCGGGAQVIFNDVECLTQQSPTGETPVSSPRKMYGGQMNSAAKKPKY